MLIPVILCGGAGSRLWPVSREALPKPFMVLREDQTLLEQTIRRGLACQHADSGYILVSNKDYQFKTAEEMAKAEGGKSSRGLQILEPTGRNTAPAIALAAKVAIERFGTDAVLLVLAADHLIANVSAFAIDVEIAYKQAAAGVVTTFGIPPTSPETGYGYIETTATDRSSARTISRFVEKPNLAKAQSFLAAGNFLWNSGMFCFKASQLLDELSKHAPSVISVLETVMASANQKTDSIEFDPAAFATFPDISIDYAVMEKVQGAKVVPASFDWSDIGSWKSVSETFTPDEMGNTHSGAVELIKCSNVHIQSSERLVAAVGVSNLVIVDTEDAILVAHKDNSQDVKEVVSKLKARGHESSRLHKTVNRPWGTYTTIQESDAYKVKRIVVRPGASLSLQLHHHRSEHWVVVKGTAKITNGEKVVLLTPNQSTYIPIGETHRLENPGMLDVVLIEVQCGSYLGEDDIVRLEDRYGR